MKLLVKTTLYYLLLTLAVFGAGGWIMYDVFKQEVDLELDRFLRKELWKVEGAIESGIPISALVNENIQICKKEGTGWTESKPVYVDTVVYHQFLKRMEPNRKVTATKKIGDAYYHISLFDVIVEADDIYDGVVRSLTRIFALLAVVVVVFAFIFSRKIFQPFEETLRKIRSFQLRDPHPIHFSTTGTYEFSMLNSFLQEMTEKVRLDYDNLREFNENASHEMQTPLAIAKGKLELLLAENDLKPDQIQLVGSAYSAIDKLSKLGRSLNLLSKIQNREFSETQRIDFSKQVEQSLFDFQELIDMKGISLESHITPDIQIDIPPELAHMLLTNLIQNAIRHNEEEGRIEVLLDEQHLTIRNTGVEPTIPPAHFLSVSKKVISLMSPSGSGSRLSKKSAMYAGLILTMRIPSNTCMR